MHWHGLRLENRYDGTHETQAPIPVGGSFSYRISFPDPGVYWYHPHIREDYGQELGQYGNILVVPAEPDYWPPAHRELLLTLDDVLIEDGKIAPFSRDETTFAAMGRYGNVLLVGGETEPSFAAQQGEVVRLYLTNTANTRVFNVALPGRADEARRRRQRPRRARGARRVGRARAVGARRRRRAVRAAGPAGARAPNARADLRARDDRGGRRAGDAAARGAVRGAAREPGVVAERERLARLRRRGARQDARLRRRDGHGRARGRRSSTPARCIPR